MGVMQEFRLTDKAPPPRLFMEKKAEFAMQVDAEVDRHFDASSCPAGVVPRFVLIMGPIAAGKTTIRKAKFSDGYVVIDAAEIFQNLNPGQLGPFPGHMESALCEIGRRVAERAVRERRNIVTEMIGADSERLLSLLEVMKALGYKTALPFVACDLEVALRRNQNRNPAEISCHFAEPYHAAWIREAAQAALADSSSRTSP